MQNEDGNADTESSPCQTETSSNNEINLKSNGIDTMYNNVLTASKYC